MPADIPKYPKMVANIQKSVKMPYTSSISGSSNIFNMLCVVWILFNYLSLGIPVLPPGQAATRLWAKPKQATRTIA